MLSLGGGAPCCRLNSVLLFCFSLQAVIVLNLTPIPSPAGTKKSPSPSGHGADPTSPLLYYYYSMLGLLLMSHHLPPEPA